MPRAEGLGTPTPVLAPMLARHHAVLSSPKLPGNPVQKQRRGAPVPPCSSAAAGFLPAPQKSTPSDQHRPSTNTAVPAHAARSPKCTLSLVLGAERRGAAAKERGLATRVSRPAFSPGIVLLRPKAGRSAPGSWETRTNRVGVSCITCGARHAPGSQGIDTYGCSHLNDSQTSSRTVRARTSRECSPDTKPQCPNPALLF